ncbi:hypothetical protein PR003_g25708 [Phytophthora rubi]|uniref:GPI inositol-deacylase n=1 Tax=Phytophthora rubi TaxID=129364 RepID=A0A6A3I4E2_9STRA|nr:hypothetical protein PR002_g24912 [Phytophthora rubi]KAE9288830.1 hypothetical protein PR003_g25708 [Phytophthora rubi]
MLVATLAFLLATLATAVATGDQDRIPKTPHHPQQNFQNEKTPDWPSLRFRFRLKRKSTNVYGHHEFDMLAKPVVSEDGVSVLYDVFATFKQGTTMYNYTLIDGVGYSSSSSGTTAPLTACLESESGSLPPINSIVAALNEATLVSSDSAIDHGVQCSTGRLYKVSVKDIEFAVCATGSSGFTMRSSDMDIEVVYLAASMEVIESPSERECPKTILPSVMTSVGQALLTGKLDAVRDTRMLKAAFDFSWGDSTCSCKSTPRPCIFIHGLGIKQGLPQNQNSFEDYWGDYLPEHAPCCSSMKFAVLDTEHYAWTDAALQRKVCNRVLAVSNSSTKSAISDTIVITHSMGNLILAGAIATKKCSLAASSSWVGLAGPMSGSMASDYFQSSCAHSTNAIVEQYADIVGICPIQPAIKSMSTENGNHSSVELDAAYKAAQKVYRKSVTALMSESGRGLVSFYQPKFWAMHHLIPYKSKNNDGMVEFQSCASGFPDSQFGTTW